MFAALPAPRPDDGALREAIRAARAEDGVLLGVLDDDPTGSQAVHGVQVVTVPDELAYRAAFDGPAATCFVLTNTRSLDEPAAVEANQVTGRALLSIAEQRRARAQLVSRSDSTLRGHVMAEVAALDGARRERSGQGFDGVLLVPAFLEAGRVTAGDIHWARLRGELVPVGETEFARDATFGYRASDLRDFVAEKSGGTIAADAVHSIGLDDIRLGGPSRVRDLLAEVRDGAWVVVNATEYSDLDAVAYGVLLAERAGRSFLFRTGPSFVRSLSGLGPKAPLRGADLWPGGPPGGTGQAGPAGGHGLIVVGSHVGHTSRQMAALVAAGGVTQIELDVPAALRGDDVVTATAAAVTAALARSDVLLYTSRDLVTAADGDGSLAIARRVSAVLSATVRAVLAARAAGPVSPATPAWIIAKGGITSHDVAVHGLGLRRAEVAGQLFPGVISVFRPLDAAPAAIGLPYVVFAGNVGDEDTLRQTVAILHGEQEKT